MTRTKPTISIIQRVLPHYRVPFFTQLYDTLAKHGMELILIYGQERTGTVPKTVSFLAPWATPITNYYFSPFGRELVWQSRRKTSAKVDLLIVELANRLLLNHVLLAKRLIRKQKLAFWGHGANFQAGNANSISERFKRLLMTRVDWWFAYTSLSADIVHNAGFSEDRITVIQNSIDTCELSGALASLSEGALDSLRQRLGISSRNVALFCGGMYPEKMLDFLIAACFNIRVRVPDFEMVFVGNGPEQYKVIQACEQHRWMHYVGPVFGQERAVYFAISRALLMPGLVGLAIVDSFVAERPMFTTDVPIHSPEIAYLEHGVNGWMTGHFVETYAEAVATFLKNPSLEAQLQAGCRESASIYTLENMVANFVDGIERCLAAPRLRA